MPYPRDWARLFEILTAARDARGLKIPDPPRPLILAGAAFSRASEIRQAWIGLVRWAEEHGLQPLLHANLPTAPVPERVDAHTVRDVADRLAGISEDGHGWWPEYGKQDHPERVKPTKILVAETLSRLRMDWRTVVGPELAQHTRPLKFTGRRMRRLVVSADPAFGPPWGDWNSASRNPGAFRLVRKSVNRFIAPMEVDDICFSTAKWTTGHLQQEVRPFTPSSD